MANHVVKDAVWQIVGRGVSAIGWFLVIKLITPYLGPLRFGDYSTILKYFAIRSALADFGMYVIALKQIGAIPQEHHEERSILYSKFVSTRMVLIGIIYLLAYGATFFIWAYTTNPYLLYGLPIGMLFSASFMAAGIVQIPLQLYRKMHQLSIGLTVARIAQIVLLVASTLWRYAHASFATPAEGVLPFLWVIVSVLISGVAQGIYVFRQGNRLLPMRRNMDWAFTKNIVQKNRQYGLAYYCSSFHTLIVLLMFSWFYPTTAWFTIVGQWALGLSLIEILLIVPSALGNSLIHKVSGNDTMQQRKSFGSLMMVVIRIGLLVCINFFLFAPHIIHFLWGAQYLATANHRWSDTLLPGLAVIVTLSFIKQVFNYLFVSTHLQNNLLRINLIGVIIGVSIGIPLLLRYQLMGGLITQGLLECLFVTGSIWTAYRHNVLPLLEYRRIGVRLLIAIAICLVGVPLFHAWSVTSMQWIGVSLLLTWIITRLSKPSLARIFKGL